MYKIYEIKISAKISLNKLEFTGMVSADLSSAAAEDSDSKLVWIQQ